MKTVGANLSGTAIARRLPSCLVILSSMAFGASTALPVNNDPLEASTITLKASGATVESILSRIEDKTGNTVRIMGKFNRPNQKVLSSKIDLDLGKTSFWEAVTELERATGTVFAEIEDGSVVLIHPDDVFGPEPDPACGAPVYAGSIRAIPRLDEFFDHLVISLQPEPKVQSLRVVDENFKIVLETTSGDRHDVEAHSFTQIDGITGELQVPFDLDLGDQELTISDIRSAQLQGELLNAKNETKALGTLKKLKGQSKPKKVGLVEVQVTSAELEEDDEGEQSFVIRIDVEGPLVGFDDFELLDKRGDVIRRGSAQAGTDNKREVRLSYSTEDIGKSPETHQLRLNAPVKITRHAIGLTFSPLTQPEKSDD